MKYAYKNGKILNGTKDMQVQTGLIILTEGEKIAAIVPEETRLSGYTEIDLQGKYIMPGLINMHVHLAGNGKPQKKQRDNAKLVKTLMSNRISRAIAYRMVAGFAKDELLRALPRSARSVVLALSIHGCAMKSKPVKRPARESLPQTRESLYRVGTWQVR